MLDERGFDDGVDRQRSKRSLIVAGFLLLGLVSVAWSVAQPYLVLGQLRDAAKKGDRDALVEHVDFSALRENLKASMNAYMARSMQSELQDNAWAGLGMLLGGAMVDRMVDAYVTPAGIAMLTQGDRPDPTEPVTQPESKPDNSVKVHQRYKSASVFHVTVQSDTSQAAMITFVLRRRGLSWKLTDIRMPVFDEPVTTGQ